MSNKALDFFNSIEMYGRKQYTGVNQVKIKFRLSVTKGRAVYRAWKKAYSYVELQFHVTKDKQYVIIGGELHSNAAEELSRMIRNTKIIKELAK